MESVLITAILLGSIAFLVSVWFFRRPQNLPPGPWSWPIVGYNFGSQASHEAFKDLAQQYGPIFSIRMGPLLAVVLNDKESIVKGLVKNADLLSHRFVPQYILAGIPSSNKDASMVWSSGQPWLDLRRFGLITLRAFGMGKKSLEPRINLEARYMCEEIDRSRGQPLEPLHVFNKATANIICQLVFGRRYEYDDAKFQEALNAMFENFGAIGDSDLARVFPFLLNLPPYKGFRKNFQTTRDFNRSQLYEHVDSFQQDNIRDLIDAYLADDISSAFSPDEFWRVVLDFFAAGTETTSSVLSWAIVYLVTHQDVQRKVQAELDSVVGRSRQPVLSDRVNLPYCEATLLEVMRIRPVLPNALPHMALGDVSLGRYTIPKGAIVISNIWAVHHDEKEWKNPGDFNPDRFLTEDKGAINRSSAWITFGVGRRECLGAQLAKMEAFLFFTNLMQRFEFKKSPNDPHLSLEGLSGLTLTTKPYKICAVER